MATIDLNLVRTCILVHESGSFAAAASRLGVPRSTVSRAVAALEEALGTALFHRTTRTVKTTDAGLALFDRVRPALQQLEASLRDLPAQSERPTGVLRLTATADFAATLLAPIIARYIQRYPEVSVELHSSSELLDLVRSGFDAALRISRGALRDSSLVARKLGVIQLQLYAAPSYLARYGTPKTPAEISEHPWIGFEGVAPKIIGAVKGLRELQGSRRVGCNDMFVMRALLRSGAGIGMLPSFLANDDVAAGALVRVLPRWLEQTGHAYLVQPGRKHAPRKVSAFAELLIEALRAHPLRGADPA